MRMRLHVRLGIALVLCAGMLCAASPPMVIAQNTTQHTAQGKQAWHSMTPAELAAVLPARATVEKERIETEMRSATGVTDGQGKVVAAVVLITAGYAANGKYSYYLMTRSPITFGPKISLEPGNYVIGWTRAAEGLLVNIYEAETGNQRGTILARPMAEPVMVVTLKLWPPNDRSLLQIGRFALPYALPE